MKKNGKSLLQKNNYPKFFKTQKEELNKGIKKDNLCGKKRIRNEDNYEKHNKYSGDTVIRKCKYLVLKNTFGFLNKQIKKVLN